MNKISWSFRGKNLYVFSELDITDTLNLLNISFEKEKLLTGTYKYVCNVGDSTKRNKLLKILKEIKEEVGDGH
jgi:hypothetical protein